MEHISKVLRNINHQESKSLADTFIETEYQTDKSDWLYKSRIPMRFRGKNFANYEVNHGNKLAFDNSKKYVDEFPVKLPTIYHSLGLFSKGIWGTGKTHLVCAIAQELINKCQHTNPVLYTTEPDMLMRIRSTYNHKEGAETESEVYRKLTTIPLLIIDDVGKEEVSDPRFVQRAWFTIINTRYDNLLPVVLTANLDPDDMAYYLGGNKNNEATFDRLYEMLQGVFYELKDKESYRRGKL